jgi:hypothetical protein
MLRQLFENVYSINHSDIALTYQLQNIKILQINHQY